MTETTKTLKYRLVTRSDFDGLVCAMLLRELGMIDDIAFVHPKDVQDGRVPLSSGDITANVPYVAHVHMAFDHHDSEVVRSANAPNFINDAEAPSTARVIYRHYGGEKRFPGISVEMMLAVDKADSGQFSRDDILWPDGWVLLSYLMDSRTGLGRFREFPISNYSFMMSLIAYCRDHNIQQILKLPDVQERVNMYFGHAEKAREQIVRCTRVHKNLAVLDLRQESTIWVTNRFMIYALFPEVNISIHIIWGLNRQNTVFAVGKSVLDRSSRSSVGHLMLRYGGGGHVAAGTCQIENENSALVLEQLIARITSDG
jgi:nanoRNase/pAp phosphatase (c-di-AMP/oligoRNAs hydrolase)